jgi:hypothetical protein
MLTALDRPACEAARDSSGPRVLRGPLSEHRRAPCPKAWTAASPGDSEARGSTQVPLQLVQRDNADIGEQRARNPWRSISVRCVGGSCLLLAGAGVSWPPPGGPLVGAIS